MVVAENITTGGHVTVSEPVAVYNPSTGVGEKNETPVAFALHQNYPNPFNPTTQIRFSVGTYGNASLRVFDMLGREIATIVNGQMQPGGYTIEFDAARLSSGVYCYRLQSSAHVAVMRMMVMK